MFAGVQKLAFQKGLYRHTLIGVHHGLESTAALLLPRGYLEGWGTLWN
jgi:hypothetical protein